MKLAKTALLRRRGGKQRQVRYRESTDGAVCIDRWSQAQGNSLFNSQTAEQHDYTVVHGLSSEPARAYEAPYSILPRKFKL